MSLRMLEFFTTYLQSGQTKPSSLDQLVALGARPLPDQRDRCGTACGTGLPITATARTETERAA